MRFKKKKIYLKPSIKRDLIIISMMIKYNQIRKITLQQEKFIFKKINLTIYKVLSK